MHLSVAGHRALLKGAKTAVDMLANAVELLPTNDGPRRSALLDLAAARREVGKLVAATASSKEALEAAIAVGDQGHVAQAKLVHLEITSDHQFERLMESEPQEIDELIESFRQLNDDAGLARVWRLRALIQAADGRSVSAAAAVQDAIGLARRTGDERLEGRCVRLHCFVLDWGPTSVDAVVRSCTQALDWSRDRGIRGVEDAALNIIARAAAMRGRFDEARTLLQMVRSLKLSEPFFQVANVLTAALVELLANRPERAVAILAEDEEHPSYPYPHVFVLSAQARALLEVGRTQEALHITQRCERIAPRSQRDAQIKWRQIRAVCMARQGDVAAAERYIRQAVHLVRRSEQIDSQAQVLVDLGETLFLADRADEAMKSLRDALVLYERKGNLVMARRTRDALARQEGSGPRGCHVADS
jgi:tetratricopeptide (TPR) repeat protein